MEVTEVTFGYAEGEGRGTFHLFGGCRVALLRWLDIHLQSCGWVRHTTPVNPVSATPVERPTLNTSAAIEWELLLAASSADPGESDLARIRRLLEKPVEWDAVLRLADHHGTSSLLCQNFSRFGELVPAAVLASLRQRYERNVHKSLFLARELMRILERLDALGLEVVPYKGIVLSEVYYGDMALRQSGDLDLFVRESDVVRIKGALGDLGYTTRLVIPEDVMKDYIASGYEWTFDSHAGPNLLELQWALQPRFYAVDFDMDGLFERAVNVTVAGQSVKTPLAEDLLLVLAAHAAKHVWGRLIWLCDIAQVVKLKNLTGIECNREPERLALSEFCGLRCCWRSSYWERRFRRRSRARFSRTGLGWSCLRKSLRIWAAESRTMSRRCHTSG